MARGRRCQYSEGPNNKIRGMFMKQLKQAVSRRGFLNGAAGLAGALALGSFNLRVAQAGSHLPKVSPDDPTAKALSYVEQSAKEGQFCVNCQLYTGNEGDAYGPCAIFPGKIVAAKGWCSSWVKKVG